jgi:hypothetical protein
MLADQNIWVLKPNDCNRGRGVEVFNKLDELKRLINDSLSQEPSNQEENPKIKSDLFVIQKYIERPMLINSRKFDIRLWVLVTQDHNCHLFKEGYVRMSSYKYTIDSDSISKRAVHLTNIAIQKLD